MASEQRRKPVFELVYSDDEYSDDCASPSSFYSDECGPPDLEYDALPESLQHQRLLREDEYADIADLSDELIPEFNLGSPLLGPVSQVRNWDAELGSEFLTGRVTQFGVPNRFRLPLRTTDPQAATTAPAGTTACDSPRFHRTVTEDISENIHSPRALRPLTTKLLHIEAAARAQEPQTVMETSQLNAEPEFFYLENAGYSLPFSVPSSPHLSAVDEPSKSFLYESEEQRILDDISRADESLRDHECKSIWPEDKYARLRLDDFSENLALEDVRPAVDLLWRCERDLRRAGYEMIDGVLCQNTSRPNVTLPSGKSDIETVFKLRHYENMAMLLMASHGEKKWGPGERHAYNVLSSKIRQEYAKEDELNVNLEGVIERIELATSETAVAHCFTLQSQHPFVLQHPSNETFMAKVPERKKKKRRVFILTESDDDEDSDYYSSSTLHATNKADSSPQLSYTTIMDRQQDEAIESGVSLSSFGDYANYISPFRRASPKSAAPMSQKSEPAASDEEDDFHDAEEFEDAPEDDLDTDSASGSGNMIPIGLEGYITPTKISPTKPPTGDIKVVASKGMQHGGQIQATGKSPGLPHLHRLTWIVSTQIEEFEDSDGSENGDCSKRTVLNTGMMITTTDEAGNVQAVSGGTQTAISTDGRILSASNGNTYGSSTSLQSKGKRPFRAQAAPAMAPTGLGRGQKQSNKSNGYKRPDSPVYEYGPDGSVISVKYPERPRPPPQEFKLVPPGVRQHTRPENYSTPPATIDNAHSLPIFYRGPNTDPSKAIQSVGPSKEGIPPRRQMGAEEAQALLLFREYMMRCEFEEVDPDVTHKDFIAGARTKETTYRWIQIFLQLGLVRGYYARRAYLAMIDGKDTVEHGREVTNWSASIQEERNKKVHHKLNGSSGDESFALPGPKEFSDLPKKARRGLPNQTVIHKRPPPPPVEHLEPEVTLNAHRIIPVELPVRGLTDPEFDDTDFFGCSPAPSGISGRITPSAIPGDNLIDL